MLSLDAPLVVLVWQWLFAAEAHVALDWPQPFVLGASVWLAYAADRWFEGWRVAPALMRTQRHRFYQRHRWEVATVWLVVLAADLGVACWRLTPREFLAGAAFLAPTLLYLLSHQLVHRHRRWRAPKELCIAVLLAGGAALFVAATPGAAIRPLIGPVALFGALCFTNVALIAVWEREVDETHGQVSLARQFRGATAITRALPIALAAIGAVSAVAPLGVPRIAAHCVAASGLLLVLIDRAETRIGWQLARVLADGALLTPAIPLLRGLHG